MGFIDTKSQTWKGSAADRWVGKKDGEKGIEAWPPKTTDDMRRQG
jgi:hypothetical protein